MASGVVLRFASEILRVSISIPFRSVRRKEILSCGNFYGEQATPFRFEADHVRRTSPTRFPLAQRLNKAFQKQVFHNIRDRGSAQTGRADKVCARARAAIAQKLQNAMRIRMAQDRGSAKWDIFFLHFIPEKIGI